MNDPRQELLERLRPYGQENLLAFWDKLNAAQRKSLAAQIRGLDLALVKQLSQGTAGGPDWAALARRAVAPPAFRLDGRGNRFSQYEGRTAGDAALAAGQVAALLVAGGQGTRLGFDHPKGMYSIGPVSHATLFQILFEKILAVGRRYGVQVPLYLMTSPATHDETVAFLAAHGNFGLSDEALHIFCQGTMPAVDAASGQILLARPGELFASPDGHGGTLAALDRSGGLAAMHDQGIEQIFYFQVDNPLVPVCDSEFLGYHLLAGSELSTQVVAKSLPAERLGNVVSIDGQVRIIEYSDLPPEEGERRAADGSLELWAGNTAVHIFDLAFLERAKGDQAALPFHLAHKQVPHVDERGVLVEPKQPNALKFERFIFDLLPAARGAIVMEVDAAQAFAPVKNAPGAATYSPECVHRQMIDLHAGWLRAAGTEIVDGLPVEISPLFALDAFEAARKAPRERRITEPTYFS